MVPPLVSSVYLHLLLIKLEGSSDLVLSDHCLLLGGGEVYIQIQGYELVVRLLKDVCQKLVVFWSIFLGLSCDLPEIHMIGYTVTD